MGITIPPVNDADTCLLVCGQPISVKPSPNLKAGSLTSIIEYVCPECGTYRVGEMDQGVVRKATRATKEKLVAMAKEKMLSDPKRCPLVITGGLVLKLNKG